MAVLHVRNIPSLELLTEKLEEYRDRSVENVKCFYNAFLEKVKYLESLEAQFIRKVNAAQAALSACHASRAVNPQISCYNQQDALRRAEENLKQYRYIMEEEVRHYKFVCYADAESFLKNNVSEIDKRSVPKLKHIIRDMRVYYEDRDMIV